MRLVRQDFKDALDLMDKKGYSTNTKVLLREYISFENVQNIEQDKPKGIIISNNLPTHIGKSVDVKGRISFASRNHCERFGWDCDDADTNHTRRTMTKVGRFLRKIWSEDHLHDRCVTNNDIEKFVEHLNLVWSNDDDDDNKFSDLELTSDIVWTYDGDNYCHEARGYYDEDNDEDVEGSGSLGGSCMRKYECREYFDLYTEESLQIVRKLDSCSEVKARALTWKGVQFIELNNDKEFFEHEDFKPSVYNFMDRVYTVDYLDEGYFKEWATHNNYISKHRQSYSDKLSFKGLPNSMHAVAMYELNDSSRDLFLESIQEDNQHANYFPYIDTFTYAFRLRPVGIPINDDNEMLLDDDDKIVMFNTCNMKYIEPIAKSMGCVAMNRFTFECTEGGHYQVRAKSIININREGDNVSKGYKFSDNWDMIDQTCLNLKSPTMRLLKDYIDNISGGELLRVKIDCDNISKVLSHVDRFGEYIYKYVHRSETITCSSSGFSMAKFKDGRRNKHLVHWGGGFIHKDMAVKVTNGTTKNGHVWIPIDRVWVSYDLDDNRIIECVDDIYRSDYTTDIAGVMRKKSDLVCVPSPSGDELWYARGGKIYTEQYQRIASKLVCNRNEIKKLILTKKI